jgi:hypothetical protein
MKSAIIFAVGLLSFSSAFASQVPATLSLYVQCDGINGNTHENDSTTFDLQTVLQSNEQPYGNPLPQSGYTLNITGQQIFILPANGGRILLGTLPAFPAQCFADQESTWTQIDVNPALQILADVSGAQVSLTISENQKQLIEIQN